jgi:hypothetical protein
MISPIILSLPLRYLRCLRACVSIDNRSLELVLVMASAWRIHDDPARLQGLGVALKGAGFRDAGYRVMSEAVAATHRALFLDRQTHQQASDLEGQGACRGVVAFYCFEYGNAWWGQWGPSNAAPGGRGLGGSEEAVVYMSRELAGLG